jgi:hypothetical protein
MAKQLLSVAYGALLIVAGLKTFLLACGMAQQGDAFWVSIAAVGAMFYGGWRLVFTWAYVRKIKEG